MTTQTFLDDLGNPYTIEDLPVDKVQPDPFQPRKSRSEESLRSLGESIKNQGLQQEIAVRPSDDDGYVVIFGHGRLAGSKMVGLTTIRAKVYDFSGMTGSDLAKHIYGVQLIENVVRQDLFPTEQIDGYHRAINDLGMSVQQLAGMMGKSTSHIDSYLKLFNLPGQVRKAIDSGDCSIQVAGKLAWIQNEQATGKTKADVLVAFKKAMEKRTTAAQLAVIGKYATENGMKSDVFAEAKKVLKSQGTNEAKSRFNAILRAWGKFTTFVPDAVHRQSFVLGNKSTPSELMLFAKELQSYGKDLENSIIEYQVKFNVTPEDIARRKAQAAEKEIAAEITAETPDAAPTEERAAA